MFKITKIKNDKDSKMHFEGTHSYDYRADPRLERVPLNMRPKNTTTQWPMANRPANISVAPDSRNYGTGLFRRYPNGEIDYKYAKGFVEDALCKMKLGIALTELQAASISAVFPDKVFKGLPKSIVRLKAYLSAEEARCLRGMLEYE